MKQYDGSKIIDHDGDKRPKSGDVYFGTFIGCPHEIGERVHISANCSFVGVRKLYIGNDTTIAPGVIIYTSSPNLDEKVIGNKYTSGFEVVAADVHIGNNVFIGAGTVIHQGVNICDRVIVGAHSFVNRDIDEPGIYVGAPVKKIKGF